MGQPWAVRAQCTRQGAPGWGGQPPGPLFLPVSPMGRTGSASGLLWVTQRFQTGTSQPPVGLQPQGTGRSVPGREGAGGCAQDPETSRVCREMAWNCVISECGAGKRWGAFRVSGRLAGRLPRHSFRGSVSSSLSRRRPSRASPASAASPPPQRQVFRALGTDAPASPARVGAGGGSRGKCERASSHP